MELVKEEIRDKTEPLWDVETVEVQFLE